MVQVIVWIVIVAAIAAVAVWALQKLGPPEPIGRVAYVVIVAVALLIIIGLAASLFGVNLGVPTPV